MTVLNPSAASAAMADGSVAPPQATVASTREKLTMPSGAGVWADMAGTPDRAHTTRPVTVAVQTVVIAPV